MEPHFVATKTISPVPSHALQFLCAVSRSGIKKKIPLPEGGTLSHPPAALLVGGSEMVWISEALVDSLGWLKEAVWIGLLLAFWKDLFGLELIMPIHL